MDYAPVAGDGEKFAVRAEGEEGGSVVAIAGGWRGRPTGRLVSASTRMTSPPSTARASREPDGLKATPMKLRRSSPVSVGGIFPVAVSQTKRPSGPVAASCLLSGLKTRFPASFQADRGERLFCGNRWPGPEVTIGAVQVEGASFCAVGLRMTLPERSRGAGEYRSAARHRASRFWPPDRRRDDEAGRIDEEFVEKMGCIALGIGELCLDLGDRRRNLVEDLVRHVPADAAFGHLLGEDEIAVVVGEVEVSYRAQFRESSVELCCVDVPDEDFAQIAGEGEQLVVVAEGEQLDGVGLAPLSLPGGGLLMSGRWSDACCIEPDFRREGRREGRRRWS